MDSPTCEGVTKAGGRCRSFTLPGSPFCFMHGNPEAAAAARSRGAVKAGALRSLEGRRKRLDSPRALAVFLSDLIHDVAEGRRDPEVAKVLFYGASVQRAVVELVGKADVERRLAELERLLAQRRPA